jgi:IPT/TIG domain.
MTLADTGKAIGAVSEAIRQRLSTIANMTVTVGRPEPPDQAPAGKKLNIFLYESQFDASFKNYPLEDGQPPPVWLVLKYLLTAFAADGTTSDNVEAHENLGLGIRALQELSILRLTPGLPSSVVKALSDNPENLHITFDEAPTELLSKVMMQGDEKYRISVAFQVRPVMIAPSELPSYSLLVGVDYTTNTIIGEEGIQTVVLPSMGPTITEISPLGFEIGDTVTIHGNDLHLSNLSVNLGPLELPVTMQQSDQLQFVVRDDVVTGNVISAGSHAISVGQLLPSGRKRLSNLLVGNLLPTLSEAKILAGSLQTVGVPPPPPPPPTGWKFATINLKGKLLGQNDKDDFYLALYRNGATVKVFENDPPLEHLKDTSPVGARQTARQCVMVRADAVPPGKYLVLYRVNGQQAVQSAELDMT